MKQRVVVHCSIKNRVKCRPMSVRSDESWKKKSTKIPHTNLRQLPKKILGIIMRSLSCRIETGFIKNEGKTNYIKSTKIHSFIRLDDDSSEGSSYSSHPPKFLQTQRQSQFLKIIKKETSLEWFRVLLLFNGRCGAHGTYSGFRGLN